jgi:hypothetical protein
VLGALTKPEFFGMIRAFKVNITNPKEANHMPVLI